MKEDKNVERKYLYFRKNNAQHVLAYMLFQKLENTKLTMAFISKLIPDFIENNSDKDIQDISSDEIICIVKDYLEGRIKLSTNSIYSQQNTKNSEDDLKFKELLKELLVNNVTALSQSAANTTVTMPTPAPVNNNPGQEYSQNNKKSTNAGRFLKNNTAAKENKLSHNESYENDDFLEKTNEADSFTEDDTYDEEMLVEDDTYDEEMLVEAAKGMSIFNL